MKKVLSKGMEVNAEAANKNVTKGAMVNVEASAVNTIKGSLVKINSMLASSRMTSIPFRFVLAAAILVEADLSEADLRGAEFVELENIDTARAHVFLPDGGAPNDS
ncbi:MAG: hypothetical protein FJ295_02325 [Planctomycetes bacterium]|nr:hypothetical protein [Planctomycetota bacterium]